MEKLGIVSLELALLPGPHSQHIACLQRAVEKVGPWLVGITDSESVKCPCGLSEVCFGF